MFLISNVELRSDRRLEGLEVECGSSGVSRSDLGLRTLLEGDKLDFECAGDDIVNSTLGPYRQKASCDPQPHATINVITDRPDLSGRATRSQSVPNRLLELFENSGSAGFIRRKSHRLL